jgi:hypothetical protein
MEQASIQTASGKEGVKLLRAIAFNEAKSFWARKPAQFDHYPAFL